MKKFYLGIDVGSTKCHAIIADESGRAVGFGKGGAGNWETVGWENTRQVLHEILDLALESGGVSREQIAGAGFGVAGFDWEEDRAPHQEIIESLNLQAPYALVNDTIIGLVAGATKGWGVVISGGTSNNCRGRDQNGREGRVTGSGIPFGEYGGAYEIVWKSIQAVAAAWTRRGPPTKLIDRFIEHSGAADIEDLISGIVRGRYEFSSAQAPQVFELAEAGDEVAREIIRWAGQQLADLALGVARQLDFLDIVFEIVLAGSLFKGSPLLTDALKEEVLAVAPRAIFTRLKEPPVVGGVLLGMEQAGVDFTGLRGRLLETTSVLVQKQSGDG
jgi:N-acetylglucosamine kinase-like BadF-type ATPase